VLVVVLSMSPRDADWPPSANSRRRCEDEWLDDQQVLVDLVLVHERLDELAASHHDQVIGQLVLERGDGAPMSPCRSVEFGQGSGFCSVFEATGAPSRLPLRLSSLTTTAL
jgi:hypothetical protein